jgi:isopentenyldiphosphate isomerase/SAM-dependent methyltransferase
MAEEIFDVVNERDEVIGRNTRGEVHRLGLMHRAVHVLVFNSKGEVFLQKRSLKKDRQPGVWDSSASGHLDSGEDYDACAVRELREELALSPTGRLRRCFKLAASPATDQEHLWVYQTRAEGPFRLHPDEIERGGWFSIPAVNQWLVERPHEFAGAFAVIWKRLMSSPLQQDGSPPPTTTEAAEDYWEHRYQAGDMPWEKGAPSPGLVDFLAAYPELPRARVCVPGCGTGHDVRAWAAAGFEVAGCDLAPSAIELASARTAEAGLKAAFLQVDFLRAQPPSLFDWVFEHTLFCAIQPAERELYVQAVLRWLKPGGRYLAVNYLIPDTDGPPFGVTREEIIQRFSPYFSLLEEWVPRSYPNRTGLERIFWWKRKSAAE